MKIFFSYSHEDRTSASAIKHALELYGVDVFLAHEDIEPSAEWIKVIRSELRKCDVFLPLLTEDFVASTWANQEMGFAVALKKVIVPLKVSIDPYGFIGQYQALQIRRNSTRAAERITTAIGGNRKVGHTLKDALIEKFEDSDSFVDAAENAERLVRFEGYDSAQVRRIVEYTIENYQINNSFKARRLLRPFIERYRGLVPARLLQRFIHSMGY